MIISPNFQISPVRNRKYDVLIRKPFLERSEAEHFLCYYFLRNIGVTCNYILGVELLKYQELIIRALVRKSFPMILLTRGGGKSFVLGVYSALRALITPGAKVVVMGSNRRQSRFIFAEAAKIYYNPKATLFRECARAPVENPEESQMQIFAGEKMSKISAFPLGSSGDKIRGVRSSHLLVDEAAIIPKEVFETVLKPTASVSLDPVSKVKVLRREKELLEAGIITKDETTIYESNQVVLSSSACYQFQSLYEQFLEYKSNILKINETTSEVERKRLSQYFTIQLSCDAIMELDPGCLDVANIENSRATLSADRFLTEYGAQFVSDSAGFFPRSLLELRSLKLGDPNCVEIYPDERYIYILGVDPAAGENMQGDFFGMMVGRIDTVLKTLTIVNAHGTTGKGWPTYVAMLKDYIKTFTPKYICCDAFGGGQQVASLLREKSTEDKDYVPVLALEKDDLTTYSPIENKILRLVVPENNWIEKANLNMKSMLDHSRLFFAAPPNDICYVKYGVKEVDMLEDASESILEAKAQISLMVGSQNDKGQVIFQMPDSLGQIKKKQRVRKDLYSCSVLMCWAFKEYFEILEANTSKDVPYNPVVVTA